MDLRKLRDESTQGSRSRAPNTVQHQQRPQSVQKRSNSNQLVKKPPNDFYSTLSGRKKLGFGHKSSSQFMGDRAASFSNWKPPIDKMQLA